MVRAPDVLEAPARNLETAFAQPGAGAMATRTPDDVVIAERTLFGEVITAQKVAAPRDEARILQRIRTMAAAAGEAWFYRFPVKNRKTGKTDYIEGPSVDCTDAVARYYGNCRVDCAVVDQGRHWLIYSRFIDLETGYTLIRPFQQDKEGARLGGDDGGRKLAIALAIGTSKSQRNVVEHALKDFTAFAFQEAQKNLVERIGAKLAEYRARAVERLTEYGEDVLKRVELAYGRKSSEWLATDLARIIAELRSIADGMASVDETWPPPIPAEPRRSDPGVTEVPPEDEKPKGEQDAPQAATSPPPPPPPPPPPTEAHDQGEPPKNWTVPADLVGQDAVLKALGDLLAMTKTIAEVDALLDQNKERLAKITGVKGQSWRNDVRTRREIINAGRA